MSPVESVSFGIHPQRWSVLILRELIISSGRELGYAFEAVRFQ